MARIKWLVAGWLAGGLSSAAVANIPPESEVTYAQVAVFSKVLHYIQTSYVHRMSPRDLIYGAIHGMVARLDLHSQFIEPGASDGTSPDTDRAHIGVRLTADGSVLKVADLLPEATAAQAGVRIGDVVEAVDGQTGLTLEQAQRRLIGAEGSFVSLRLQRGGSTRTIEFRRDRFRPLLVHWERRGSTGILRIRRFTSDTPLDVRRALDRFHASNLQSLILDLRGNPGGLVDAAAQVADFWMRTGIIVTTEARGETVERWSAHRIDTEPDDYPLLILVDGQTASAAEIVAAALQESGRAEVVGVRTFGKGSVQTIIELEDGSVLKLTIALYRTPSHRAIQGVGVEPDHAFPVQAWARGPLEPARDLELEHALAHVQSRVR
ncbi:MAG: S41 family peptidase [Myxococcota bacterium]